MTTEMPAAREPGAKYLARAKPALVPWFDLLATAPSGVAKLRELVLGLAVQGKLLGQDEGDEPATELLTRIQANRQQLVSSRQLRGRNELLPVSIDEQTYALPTGWAWTRLGDLGDWGAGATPLRSKAEYYGGNVLWFKSGELTADFVCRSEETVTALALKECSLRSNQIGDVLIAMYGATIGKVSILAREGTTNQAVCACTPFDGFDNRYLLLTLKSLRPYFIGIGAGGAQPNISREKIISTVIGLPPLAEQHRIVARVEELMKLCDALEKSGRLADEKHARLTSTLFDALAASESAHALAENWHRIAEHFDLLLDRTEAVDALEKTIVQLAVEGTLVSPGQSSGEWREVTLGEVVALLNGYAFKSEWFRATGVRLVRNVNVSHGSLVWNDPACVEWIIADELSRFALVAGDVVLSLDRPIISTGLKYAVVQQQDLPCLLLQRVARLHPLKNVLAREYLELWLNSPAFVGRIDPGHSNGVPHISTRQLQAIPIALPPLAEQHRIVARVEELRRLCANLRRQLSAVRETQSHLSNAMVTEVA